MSNRYNGQVNPWFVPSAQTSATPTGAVSAGSEPARPPPPASANAGPTHYPATQSAPYPPSSSAPHAASQSYPPAQAAAYSAQPQSQHAPAGQPHAMPYAPQQPTNQPPPQYAAQPQPPSSHPSQPVTYNTPHQTYANYGTPAQQPQGYQHYAPVAQPQPYQHPAHPVSYNQPPSHYAPQPAYNQQNGGYPARQPPNGAYHGHQAQPPHPPAHPANMQAGGYAVTQVPGGFEMLSWQPSGRKRALLVGINYSKVDNGRNRLRGCVNDVKMMKYLLVSRFGFRNEDFWVMTDENAGMASTVRQAMPTRMNILSGMRWLVSNAQAGDSLFFQFSGHGSQVLDTSGDEADGYDETILPMDHKTAGQIVDDTIFDIMVKPLPAHVRLTAVMDCCHSGTGMDLPYIHLAGSDSYEGFGARGLLDLGPSSMSGLGGIPLGLGSRAPRRKGNFKMLMDMLAAAAGGPGTQSRPLPPPRPVSAGEIILFSGCQDNQTSADVGPSGGQSVSSGAMTYSFIEAIEHGSTAWQDYTYKSLCQAMRIKLRNKGYRQIPQLSTSRPFDLNSPFRV